MEIKPWEIIEKEYCESQNAHYETLFSLGNGYMGARGRFEEGFSGDSQETYPGNYIAGVYDSFEESWVELVNVPDFWAMKVFVDTQPMDLRNGKVENYSRVLDMHKGTLTRIFDWSFKEHKTRFEFQRFMSMDNKHLAAQRIRVTPLNHNLPITIETQINGEVFNRRQRDWPYLHEIIPNYHLDPNGSGIESDKISWLAMLTKSSEVDICICASLNITGNGVIRNIRKPTRITQAVKFSTTKGEAVGLDKLISVYTSRDEFSKTLRQTTIDNCRMHNDYDTLLQQHIFAWEKKWEDADIVIEGDPATQQGLRFNIFHLIQANASDDPFVNIPAKLLTHTRYKGCSFWDTEMFMFPFFVYTNPEAAKNLLMYRYNLLPAARKIAKEHWCSGARYPFMSADTGSNQCNNWEYGDCEVHITADIAYAIDQYVNATGDMDFLAKFGAEILIETARYWKDRTVWDNQLNKYVLISVKGPDEYCGVTNNNMYTNYLVSFNCELAEKAVLFIQKEYPECFADLTQRIGLSAGELEQWHDIREKMYYNWDGDILIQDDTFLAQPMEDLSQYKDRTKPLCEIMPIERLMRVRLLRQADIVLLMYLLNDRFTHDQKRASYDFYEPITTHDSSLSYNTHAIMAAELGDAEKALNYLRKTARLDLDDELNTARHGIHGASTGGTWQTVVNGFGGLRLTDGKLSLVSQLPAEWQRLVFKIKYYGRTIEVDINHESTTLTLVSGEPVDLLLNGKAVIVK